MSGVVFIVTVPKLEIEEERRKSIIKSARKSVDDARQSKNQQLNLIFNFENESTKSSIDIHECDARKPHRRNSDTVIDFGEKISHCSTKSFVSKLTNLDEIERNELNTVHDRNENNDDEDLPTEKIIKEVLKVLKIDDAVWNETGEGTSWQITFSVLGRVKSEKTLHILKSAGIGSRSQTTLCVLPCALLYKKLISTSSPIRKELHDCHQEDENEANQSAWGTFINSVRARQSVAQVVEHVRSEAELTFDFLFLLMVAAIVAAIGLVENSTVFLVASMLISPLMGPIMAGTFGTAIRDRELLKMGVKHELFGLFFALVIGFLFGLIICAIDENYGVGEWPTLEITSRCELRSLWVGALVAVPSGAAVAIAILSGNTSSLVGVAISASLLPPAVNAGLLWAMSLIHLIFKDDDSKFTTVVKTHVYSDNPAIELAVNGSISLCLTLVNIAFIYIAGILVYKIKEVTPSNSDDEQFWKEGIKAIRNYNKRTNEEVKSQKPNEFINNNSLNNIIQSPHSPFGFDVRNSFHSFVERFQYLGSGHMTWSPRRLASRRLSTKETVGFYRQLSDDRSALKRRLSYPANQISNYKQADGKNKLSMHSETNLLRNENNNRIINSNFLSQH